MKKLLQILFVISVFALWGIVYFGSRPYLQEKLVSMGLMEANLASPTSEGLAALIALYYTIFYAWSSKVTGLFKN